MADYDTITLSRGERDSVVLYDGESFENKLIDISASGAAFRVILRGRNTTIRNVGWTGVQDVTGDAVIGIGSVEGSTLIENVYMGDGSTLGVNPGEGHPTAIWAARSASGSLTIRNANVQSWSDNGMYLSNAQNLDVTIDKCYASDNPSADYRVTDGAVIRDSVVWDAYHRAVWGWGPGTVEVQNCHLQSNDRAIIAGGARDAAPTINVRDSEVQGTVHAKTGTINETNVGSNPQNFYPPGTPTTAKEAASGGGVTVPDPDPCEGVTCPDGEHCEDGQCVPDDPPTDPDPPDGPEPPQEPEEGGVPMLGLGLLGAALGAAYGRERD